MDPRDHPQRPTLPLKKKGHVYGQQKHMLEIEKLNRKIAVAKKHGELREIALEEYRTNAIASRLGLLDNSRASSNGRRSSESSAYLSSQSHYESHRSSQSQSSLTLTSDEYSIYSRRHKKSAKDVKSPKVS